MTQEKLPHRKELCLQSEPVLMHRLLLYYVSYEPFTEITVTETVRPGWTG